MTNSLPVTLLIVVVLYSGLMAGETRITLPDSTSTSPVSVIYIENQHHRASVKLPQRPIAQTIIGIILCSEAVFSAGMGTYYFMEADRVRKDPNGGSISSGIEAALDDVAATIYMIYAGGNAIPGTIMCVAAKKRWDTFNKAQASLGLRFDPRRNSLGAVARIDF